MARRAEAAGSTSVDFALLLYRRQHDAIEDAGGNDPLQPAGIMARVDHDHEVERRADVPALNDQADAGGPGEYGAVAEGAAEPPLVAVEEQPFAVDTRLHRLGGPA